MKINSNFYKCFIVLAFLLFTKTVFAQNVGISSSSGFTPDASAALDVSYTNKGLLIPRVALTATNVAGPIASPAVSLLVYNTATAGTAPNTVIPGYYYWSGTLWMMLSTTTQTAASSWSTTGNTGTSYPTNYFGTTDNFGLHFKTNAAHRLWIDSLGSVAVGANPIFSATREKFLVDAGTTTSYNVISGKGSINNYLQLNIQNNNNGTSASSDVVATNDAGTEANGLNFIDMGVNSSTYNLNTYPILNGANNTYLYGTGNDMIFGNATAAKSLVFFTGGTALTNERMRIDGGGNVGIGTTTPTEKLDVTGNIKASGSVFVDVTTTNTGVVAPGLILGGTNSGEGISSKRTAGNNQNGLDFYTSFNNRMSITNNGNVGIGTTTPSEKLDVAGNLKFSGALMPNNNAGTAGYFLQSTGTGTAPTWINASNYISTNAWSLNGNAGTTAGTNFIGTTDAKDFVAKTNNTERLRISTTGDVAIGGTAFNSTNPEQLLVDAGGNSTTPATSFNVISGKGYIDKYLQLNIQNTAATASASSDVVASNDMGSETTNYIDMGINSSGYATGGLLGGPSTAYVLATGNDFAIGNGALNKNLIFFTSGTTSPATNTERMRIDPSGNVGINVTTTPTAKLEVEGNVQLGVGGTVFNNLMRGNFTINNTTSFNAADKITSTVTINGVNTGATVLVNPTTSLPGAIAIASVRVSAANTIVIAFVNTSTTNNTVGQVTFNYTIIQ